MRSVHLATHPEDGIWALLMADDLKLESTAAEPEKAIIAVLLLWLVLGVALAWKKVQGGQQISWIGYEVRLDELSLGISAGRARWAVEWPQRMARDVVAELGGIPFRGWQIKLRCGRACVGQAFLVPAICLYR